MSDQSAGMAHLGSINTTLRCILGVLFWAWVLEPFLFVDCASLWQRRRQKLSRSVQNDLHLRRRPR